MSSTNLNGLVRASRGAVLAAALVLPGGLPNLCLSQPSPVGTWDCLSSGGGQPGIAFFTFTSSPSNTFTADLLVASVPNTPTSPRNSPTDETRNNGTNSIFICTNLFGYYPVDGPWSFDSKGRVIGAFIQLIQVAPVVTVNWNPIKVDTGPILYYVTNFNTAWTTQWTDIPFYVEGANLVDRYRSPTNLVVPIPFDGPAFQTTIEWTALNVYDGYTNTYSTNITVYNTTYTDSHPSSTNFTVSFAAATLDTNVQWTVVSLDGYINNYSQDFHFIDTLGYTLSGVITNKNSFVGTVVPNKRLTLRSSSDYGNVTYTGVPMNVNKLPNISGNWYAIKYQGGEHFVEQLFNLTPSILPYLYFADNGQGPGYSLFGWVMVSSKKKIGFALDQLPWGETNVIVRASFGPLNVSPKITRTKTRGIDQTGVPFDFTATLQP